MDEFKFLYQYYSLQPKEIHRIQSVWKVTTDRGVFAVKKSHTPPEHFQFVVDALHRLYHRGFGGIVPYVMSNTGIPYIPLDEGILYVTPWIEGVTGGELVNHQPLWLDKAFEQLGIIHRLCRKESVDWSEVEEEATLLLNNWSQMTEWLHECIELVHKRMYPSPVDVVFMANADLLVEMGVEACGRLDEWCKHAKDRKELEFTFCHGRISPDHLIYSDQLYMINYDHASMDFPARDLAYLIRSAVLKAKHGDLVVKGLQLYLEENPLQPADLEVLKLSLLFPAQIIHFLKRYYSKQFNPKWTEMALVRRFERLIAEHLSLRNF